MGVSTPLGAILIKPIPDWLPWTVVAEWADRHGYDDEARQFLDHCIHEMDDEYLAWWRETYGKQADS